MNEVDYLVSVRFSTLSIEQKLEIKRLGPHRPDDLTICQAGKDKTRTFNKEWFKRKLWLTGSSSKKALYCFPCLLFGGETVWTTTGFSDLKHLSERLYILHLSLTVHTDVALNSTTHRVVYTVVYTLCGGFVY